MDLRLIKTWVVFFGGLISSMFFVWFGFKFLFMANNASDLTLFMLGAAGTLGAVFALSSKIPQKEVVGISLLLIGIYYFARASGIIEGAWLLRILGIASLLAAGLMIYVTYPKDNDRKI